ncbi:MAG: EAL domain-containing protein [Gammaproteobacteria bacterium]|nr:EAL domain-containing protein [Gammaproteobacteria bacterium]
MDKKNQKLDVNQQRTLALELCNVGICNYELPPVPSVDVSPAWASILGYSIAEIPKAEIFLSWWGQQIHPNDHARVINTFNQLYAGDDEKLFCSFRLKNKAGDWCEVEVFATVLERDRKGWARHVLSVMRDVTNVDNRYKQIVENLHEGIWVIDKQNYIRFVNQSVADMLGYSVEEMLGKLIFNFQDEESKAQCRERIVESKKGNSASYEIDMLHKDGHKVLLQVESAPLYDARKNYDGIVEGIKNISEIRQQQLQLKMLSSAVEQSGSMVMITNRDADIEYVNPKFCEVTGYCEPEVIGKNANILRSENMEAGELTDLWAAITTGEDWHGEVSTQKKNGEMFWSLMSVSSITDERGRISHFVTVSEDVSQLKEARMKMEELAYVDSLTGLANRVLFRDRLEQVLKSVQRSQSNAALLFLDLDQFKRINDSLGHDVGDALLMKIAERLRQCVRHQDTVARMGGDEFVILLTDIDGMAGASSVARKILDAMSKPNKLLKHEIIITPSIGITLAPDDSLNADILLKNADLAMYKAKSQGRNNYQFFTEEMNAQILDHLLIENELRKAIENDELVLNFQPQRSIKTGQLISVEALVRWQHPEKGLLSPDSFIPVAEVAGLMSPLGEWVLRNACKKWRQLEQKGMPTVKLAVNLSPRQFRDPNLINMIQNILNETGFKPIQLELEITETTLMEHIEHAIEILDHIKALGISISIDDFGTGYSSLNYLKRLPIDALKIDQAFISDIPRDKDDMEIAAAVIAMAHKLKLQVIAEGVESKAQWDFLKRNQCDLGQGYMIGKPMSSKEILKLVLDHGDILDISAL